MILEHVRALAQLIDLSLDEFRIKCVNDTLGICMNLHTLLTHVFWDLNNIRMVCNGKFQDDEYNEYKALYLKTVTEMQKIEDKIVCINAIIDVKSKINVTGTRETKTILDIVL